MPQDLRDRLTSGLLMLCVGIPVLYKGFAVFGMCAFIAMGALLFEGHQLSLSLSKRRATVYLLCLGTLVGYISLFVFYAQRSLFAPAFLWFFFPAVWITDSAAYFGGRLLGGPLLAPQTSPKKTWSGALVGTSCAVLFGCLYLVHKQQLNTFGLFLSLLIPVACILGDLAESAMKRWLGVKDTSTLIPGHGGLWDRLDGTLGALAALSLLYFFSPGTLEGFVHALK